MNHPEDLLRQYARDRSDAAFAQIVADYAGLVHAAARRQVADAHLADDVVQGVFLLLARKADSVAATRRVGGWLIKTTHLVAREALRQQSRRQRRERKAAEMAPQFTPPSDDPAATASDDASNIRPHLDAALARLKDADRDLVVQRFFRDTPLPELATAAGLTEAAARKRIERALDKLRLHLARAGVTPAPAATLPILLAAAANHPVPNSLVQSVLTTTAATAGRPHILARDAATRSARTKLTLAATTVVCSAAFVIAIAFTRPQPRLIREPSHAAARMTGNTYTATFDTPPGDEWSSTLVDHTPVGHKPLLGQFTDQPVSLSLESLPPHTHLRVSFDLLILMSWDGSGIMSPPPHVVGPDTWDMRVDRDRILLWQTFSNHPNDPGFADEIKLQNYPSPVPGDKFPSQTGAAERQTLGYTFEMYGYVFPMDATYHMHLLFPHTADTATLTFWGLGRGKSHPQANGHHDASWGLRNVKVEALTASDVHLLTASEAEQALATAIGPDPLAASAAFWRLAAGGPAVRSLMEQAQAAVPVDHDQVRQIIRAVAHTSTRKAGDLAAAPVKAIGPLAESDLLAAVAANPSTAFRKKVEPIVRALAPLTLTDPAQRRAAVAARVLEIIGPN